MKSKRKTVDKCVLQAALDAGMRQASQDHKAGRAGGADAYGALLKVCMATGCSISVTLY